MSALSHRLMQARLEPNENQSCASIQPRFIAVPTALGVKGHAASVFNQYINIASKWQGELGFILLLQDCS